MEANVTQAGWNRQRVIIPTVVVGILTVLLSAGIIFRNNSRKTDGPEGKGGKNLAVAAGGAAAAKKDGKGKNGEKEKAPVPVSIAEVALGPVSSYISATANLVAEHEVKIVAESDGRIAQMLVEEGQFVRAGQPLASLVRDDAEIALTKARVRSNNARMAYRRASEMQTAKLISQGEYDKTSMEKDVAEQELAEAQWRLGKTTIRAPFDGRVTERVVTRGQHLKPGETLFTITDYDPLIARIYLPERDVVALNQGREVRISMKADESIVFKGRVRQISPVVDTATGTVKVTVEAVNPPPAARPGAFVNIAIIRETRANAVLVPREAVVRELREAHVFVTDGKTAHKRAVTVGLEEGSVVQATAGLKPGEKVIVAGQGGLKDGSPVKVLAKG
jgi:membrane fusion protein, multidrug efflux system